MDLPKAATTSGSARDLPAKIFAGFATFLDDDVLLLLTGGFSEEDEGRFFDADFFAFAKFDFDARSFEFFFDETLFDFEDEDELDFDFDLIPDKDEDFFRRFFGGSSTSGASPSLSVSLLSFERFFRLAATDTRRDFRCGSSSSSIGSIFGTTFFLLLLF